MTAFLGKVDVMKYTTINATYFAKPTIKARSFGEVDREEEAEDWENTL